MQGIKYDFMEEVMEISATGSQAYVQQAAAQQAPAPRNEAPPPAAEPVAGGQNAYGGEFDARA